MSQRDRRDSMPGARGERDEARALDTGADDFLSKPFAYLVLVARLRALVRCGSAPRPVVLCVVDLELDPATRRCRRGGQDIALTPARVARPSGGARLEVRFPREDSAPA